VDLKELNAERFRELKHYMHELTIPIKVKYKNHNDQDFMNIVRKQWEELP